MRPAHKGRAFVGTRKVTPTKRGFKALEKSTKSIGRELAKMEKKRKRPTITYDLRVTFKGRDPVELKGVGLQRLKDIRKPKKKQLKTLQKKLGKKKITRADVVADAVERHIRARVFDVIRSEFPDIGDSPKARMKLRKWARKKVEGELRAMKKKRGAGFQISFYREG